ncbi:MAG: hypothetical protein KBC96_02535 [Armatimonadetes bacterium]|nr:hypothetical protein [Armatimonadota bacterium]
MKAFPRSASVIKVGALLLILSGLLCGCGGGGSTSSLSELPASGPALDVRSVNLNNYNNWTPPRPERADYGEQVRLLAARDRICMTEFYARRSGLTPDTLRRMNPNAKIYQTYVLCGKNMLDPDCAGVTGSHLQTPMLYDEIVKNDWWLRDGDGNVIKENDQLRFLDAGKPGFKEMVLANVLARMEGKGYDGVLFDYHLVNQGMYTKWVTGVGIPAPEAYPDERQWFEKAAQPLMDHVVKGLRSRGYEVICNCGGETYDISPEAQWLRGIIDGTVYENWALNSDGEWASQSAVEMRINSFLDDPLDAWVCDYALRSSDTEYDKKLEVALAMYYVGLPQSPSLRAKRSYAHYKNQEVFWEPLWDFAIGDPSALPEKMSGKYFWSRKYTQGLVLLNYEHSEAITYPLDRAYRTPKGTALTKSVTVKPHTALILAAQ